MRGVSSLCAVPLSPVLLRRFKQLTVIIHTPAGDEQ